MSRDWALYNTLKYWSLFNLTEDELRVLLLSLSENELKLAKICKKNDSKWEAATATQWSHLLDSESRKNYKTSAGYPSTDEQSDSGSDNNTDTDIFKTSNAKVQHPRLHNRKEINVECKIQNAQGREFVSTTVDLSEGGLHFKDIIPDWVAGYFIVKVDGRFELMCSIVEDQKEKTRVQIVSEDEDAVYIEFKNWFQSL